MAWQSRYGNVRSWVYRIRVIVEGHEQQVVIPEAYEPLIEPLTSWLDNHAVHRRFGMSEWHLTKDRFMEFKLKYSDWFV